MFSLLACLCNLIYFALHVTGSGSFPRPLTAREERECLAQIAQGDEDKNVRFSTYASRCIENEILMHFRNKKKSAQDVFLSDPVDTDKDGNSLTLMDLMAEDDNIIDCIDLHIKSEQLYCFISKVLDARERQIIVMRYGLGGTRPLTQREVAQKLDISRSYVSRIEKRAINALQKQFEKHGAFS